MLDWDVSIYRAIAFKELESVQERAIQEVLANPQKAHLLLSEPSPTFTSGISAAQNDLLWSQEELSRQNIEIVKVNRGGKWTFHGPGQIVIYPILSLATLGWPRVSTKRFVDTLAQSVANVLKQYSIPCERRDCPYGLYVEEKKIASFGVALHHGVTSHGAALYYGPQTNFFEGIHPCGVTNQPLTSIQEMGASESWEEIAWATARELKNAFLSN